MIEVVNLHQNIIGGVGFAVLAVLIDAKPTKVGVRNYLTVIILAALCSATIIEQWLLGNSFLKSCVVGLGVGIIIDDVYLNLKATLPELTKKAIETVFDGVLAWLRKLVGLGSKE